MFRLGDIFLDDYLLYYIFVSACILREFVKFVCTRHKFLTRHHVVPLFKVLKISNKENDEVNNKYPF